MNPVETPFEATALTTPPVPSVAAGDRSASHRPSPMRFRKTNEK
jgi:hypothetical protein